MNFRRFCAATAIAALASFAGAQTGYSITGYMSNFDCTNHCDYDCDELEVQIEGIHPEDIMHTYHNPNYGAPTVTLSSDGRCTIVDYRNPQHLSQVGRIEHFGITVRGMTYGGPAPSYPIRIRWFRDGHPATVNGQVPNPTTGGSTPATQPIQPSITTAVNAGSLGHGGVQLTVTNNDPVQGIWIMRRAQIRTGLVTLEELMTSDPIVLSTVSLDAGPLYLAPLNAATISSDLIELEEMQNAIFTARYNYPGPELGNVMTATLAQPEFACASNRPIVDLPPQSVTAAADARVDLRVSAHGDDLSQLTYQWTKEGVDLTDGNGFTGATTSHLRIRNLRTQDQGFYAVRVTNFCATVVTPSALVFMNGNNSSPIHSVECPAVTLQPESMSGCASGPNTFTVYATGSDLVYRWHLAASRGQEGGALTDGLYIDSRSGARFEVAGASTRTLTISNVQAGFRGGNLEFDASISNTCSTITTTGATLSVCACLACPADFNLDGGVDGSDVTEFFGTWDSGSCDADVNADGGVDGSDVDSFFNAWVSGGC
ncbi:MAG: immunoglobulin domain-containing protein [Planctomycetota bacterium]|nr:immunoglobulin domain-containing protein [Planctomycetota bacterium]